MALVMYVGLHVAFHASRGPCGNSGCGIHLAAEQGKPRESHLPGAQRLAAGGGGGGGAGPAASQGFTLDAQGSLVPTIYDIGRVKSYPHVDECRQCRVCIPQYLVDEALGNASRSSRSGGGGGLAGLLRRRPGRQLLAAEPGAALPLRQGQGQGQWEEERGRRQRRRRRAREQQWLDAAAAERPAAAAAAPPRQRRRRRGLLQAELAKPIDGVRTHLEWLERQRKGMANNDTRSVPGIQVIVGLEDNTFAWQGNSYRIGPSSIEQDQSKTRSCSVCRGCAQLLQPMPKGLNWLGAHFSHEVGASTGWLVRAQSPQEHSPAAVKVWCVPVPKPGSRVPAVCRPDEIRRQLQMVLALQGVAHSCGLDGLLPRHWVAPVDGVLPGSGFRVSWDGLWADLVVGASAENLVRGGRPGVAPEVLLDFLQTQLNSTQVAAAAVFDLLFSQCDRHPQNLYLKPGGSLALIDNDQTHGASWRPCGVDSLFLPGTQKFEVARLGYRYVMKKPEYAPPKTPQEGLDPLQLLDYRCHSPGGAIGTRFPPQVTRCLKRLSRLSPKAIQERHGYPSFAMAAALHQRSKDLLALGFEWTLKYGWPQNPSPNRYKWSRACCGMRVARPGAAGAPGGPNATAGAAAAAAAGAGAGAPTLECTAWRDEAAGWHVDLPAGDAALGIPWDHDGGDTGTYDLAREWAGEAFDVPNGAAA